jgi:hypothetical protein
MDKLTVINNALSTTGNSTVNILYDPSDEYRVSDLGFDRAIKTLTARHSWPFATTVEKLVRAPDAENLSRNFRDSGFRLPPNAFHIKEVFWNETPLTDYEIIGQILSCDHDSDVYAKVVRQPANAVWHPMAEEVLTLMVEAACLRGLNEDFREALVVDRKVESLLLEVRTHVDQQNPARNVYKSSIRDARRARRG